MPYHSLMGKSIIITGASRGIGRELALQLAEQGAFLTLAARDTGLLAQVAEQCVKKGGKAIAVTTDITIEDQCKTLIQRANEVYGQIDVLINNAGIADKARFEELRSLSSGEMVMCVNFWGSIYCTYYAIPYLKKTKGRIVVINSGAGKFPSPTSIFYGASKHALDGFFNSLRLELQTSGVTVTSIYPDWVATGISTRFLGFDGKTTEKVSSHEYSAINADKCAKIILKAAGKRKHMTFMSMRQRIGYFLRPLFPNMIDHIAGKFFD